MASFPTSNTEVSTKYCFTGITGIIIYWSNGYVKYGEKKVQRRHEGIKLPFLVERETECKSIKYNTLSKSKSKSIGNSGFPKLRIASS